MDPRFPRWLLLASLALVALALCGCGGGTGPPISDNNQNNGGSNGGGNGGQDEALPVEQIDAVADGLAAQIQGSADGAPVGDALQAAATWLRSQTDVDPASVAVYDRSLAYAFTDGTPGWYSAGPVATEAASGDAVRPAVALAASGLPRAAQKLAGNRAATVLGTATYRSETTGNLVTYETEGYVRQGVADSLRALGYQVDELLPPGWTVDALAALGDAGPLSALFFSGHSSPAVICTAEPYDPAKSRRYRGPESQGGYPRTWVGRFGTDTGDYFGVSVQFLKRYIGFTSASLLFVEGCDFMSGGWATPVSSGAGAVVGWSRHTWLQRPPPHIDQAVACAFFGGLVPSLYRGGEPETLEYPTLAQIKARTDGTYQDYDARTGANLSGLQLAGNGDLTLGDDSSLGAVRVVVTDSATSAPIPGSPLDVLREVHPCHGEAPNMSYTDASGACWWHAVPPLDHVADLWRPSDQVEFAWPPGHGTNPYATQSVEVTGGRTAEVAFSYAWFGSATITVVDACTSAPIGGANVELEPFLPEGGQTPSDWQYRPRQGATDPDGLLHFENVQPGHYYALVSASGDASGQGSLQVTTGEEATLTVALWPHGGCVQR